MHNLKESVAVSSASISRMIDHGFDVTWNLLNEIMYNGYDDTESIYESIRSIRSKKTNRTARITADMLATNFNKILQKMVSRGID